MREGIVAVSQTEERALQGLRGSVHGRRAQLLVVERLPETQSCLSVPAAAFYRNVTGGRGEADWKIKYSCDIGKRKSIDIFEAESTTHKMFHRIKKS